MLIELQAQDTYRHHSQDGVAHMTYYRPSELLSFVWDMNAHHPIEVEHGGYGETLLALIKLMESDLPDDVPATPQAWAVWFKATCDSSVDRLRHAMS